jgi:hypothetical protein
MAEGFGLNPIQSRFESERGYSRSEIKSYFVINTKNTLFVFLWDIIIMKLFKNEPVLSWAVAHVAVNGTQLSVINVPVWVHVIILVATSLASGAAARQQVKPNAPVD